MSSLNDYAVGATLRRRLLTKTNVVLAVIVLAVVIAIAATVMPSLIPKSDEERYLADQSKIDLVVLTYRTGYPGRPLKGGGYGRRSGVIGLGDAGRGLEFGLNATFAEYHRGTKEALKLADVDNGEITILGVFQTNPAGGSRGGTPFWEDVDANGARNTSAEKLFYDKAETPSFCRPLEHHDGAGVQSHRRIRR